MERSSTESAVRKARLIRGKGITYDTGFFNAGVSTREPFDPEVVKREMRIIHDDLHCNAVRITGGNADRLELAAIHAAEAGLEVWFSPFTCDLTTDELLDFLDDCAERAERLRRQGVEVVFVTGAELSLFTVGFLPGDALEERLEVLTAPHRLRELLPQISPRLNDFLGKAVARARERFGGKISYASIPSFESVDWTPFDFISVDAYRSSENANRYRDAIRALVAQGKPIAITEFGCTTFRGASDKSSWGGMIVEYENKRAVRLNGDYIRDEAEQATHLCELLDIFTAEGVDTAFANTFASYFLPHRRDPRLDLDRASYGVVKVLEDRPGHSYPDMPWEPKAAFTALADFYHD
ncbi:MAG: hypothetical protein M3Z08_02865 [Chloroflexota bacterium]|nr:hypothetical protein [Chloroflexota bacterium]